MAVGVVEHFEVIEVDEQEPKFFIGLVPILQVTGESASIRKLRE